MLRPNLKELSAFIFLTGLLVVPATSVANLDLMSTLSYGKVVRSRLDLRSCEYETCELEEQFDEGSLEALDETLTRWSLEFKSVGAYFIIRRNGTIGFVGRGRSRDVYSDVDQLIGGSPPHPIRVCKNPLVNSSMCVPLMMVYLDSDMGEGSIKLIIENTKTSIDALVAETAGVRIGESGAKYLLEKSTLIIPIRSRG